MAQEIDESYAACELPLRSGLPCRHWMLRTVNDRLQLSSTVFHHRWLVDGPPVVHEQWIMSWEGCIQAAYVALFTSSVIRKLRI